MGRNAVSPLSGWCLFALDRGLTPTAKTNCAAARRAGRIFLPFVPLLNSPINRNTVPLGREGYAFPSRSHARLRSTADASAAAATLSGLFEFLRRSGSLATQVKCLFSMQYCAVGWWKAPFDRKIIRVFPDGWYRSTYLRLTSAPLPTEVLCVARPRCIYKELVLCQRSFICLRLSR